MKEIKKYIIPSESWYSNPLFLHLNTTQLKEKWNSLPCFRGLSSISFSSSFSGLVPQPAFLLLEYQKPRTIVVLNRAFPPFGTTRHPKRGIGKIEYTTCHPKSGIGKMEYTTRHPKRGNGGTEYAARLLTVPSVPRTGIRRMPRRCRAAECPGSGSACRGGASARSE